MNWLHGLFAIGILIGSLCFLLVLFIAIEGMVIKSETWSTRTCLIIIGVVFAAIAFMIGSIN